MSTQGFKGSFRQSMAWFHTWIGLVLSVLLYFIFITGSFGYFRTEVNHWMQPEQKLHSAEVPSHSEMAEAGFAYLAQAAPEATRFFIAFPTQRHPALYYYAALPEENEKGDKFVRGDLDPSTGQPLQARETGGGDALYAMHYSLHYMPYRVAIYIVGVATMFMFIALITGIVIHKKIFVDFFTLRLGKGQRSWLDGHNISSVLALPFLLMITYSGLVFYTFDYMPGVAALSMGVEDATEQIGAHLYPDYEPVEPSGEQASMASVGDVMTQAQQVWPAESIRYVNLENRGDRVALFHVGQHSQGLSRGSGVMKFNAITGEMLDRPEHRLGADVVFTRGALALHEGHFANIHLRWLYFLSGLIGAAMVATGMILWAKKRRTRLGKKGVAGNGLKFVERTNLAIIVGLPLGVGAYFWANRLLPLGLEGRPEWEMHCLFLVWLASFFHAGFRELGQAWREQLAALGATFALLPVVDALTTNAHLIASLREGDWVRAGFDIAVLMFAGAVFIVLRNMTPSLESALGSDAREHSSAVAGGGARAASVPQAPAD
ncbi:MAG: PepSY-associated TM helix domain-containing protein [Pseudomonadota bacterium]